MKSREEYIKDLKIKFDNEKWENPETVKNSYFDFLNSENDLAVKLIPNKNKAKLGESKIGGTPDLPKDMEWPVFEGKAMVFLAQLNLSEVALHHNHELLPKDGILYFFVYFPEPVNQYGACFDFILPKENYKILYYNRDISELKSMDFPDTLIPEYQFEDSLVTFKSFFEIPSDIYAYTEWQEEEDLSYNDNDHVIKFHQNILKTFETIQILGTPLPVQDFVSSDWAYTYIEHEESNEDEEELEADFVNLLSLPIFSKIGDSIGYFGIRKGDLIAKKFEKTVFIMQGS
ncbi:DUF1963 domain-containing protein [Aquimarina sp. AU58]|uniref:DUF1963 domain-containing protein n=1 Tax=Aquimarina sp. AU58 TaxID=1874112 RepID=UPI000D6E2DA8|nr:YwqG family protein [Aquimarina sp. AU58]